VISARKGSRCNDEGNGQARQAGETRVEELEALVCPPRQRKMLRITVADGADENAAKARAVEEHLGLYPQDPNGVEDYDWIVRIIITSLPR
jgi:hypothetical protein